MNYKERLKQLHDGYRALEREREGLNEYFYYSIYQDVENFMVENGLEDYTPWVRAYRKKYFGRDDIGLDKERFYGCDIGHHMSKDECKIVFVKGDEELEWFESERNWHELEMILIEEVRKERNKE